MNAYLLSFNPDANVADQWDFGFLRDFLEGRVWQPPGWEGFEIKEVSRLDRGDDRAIVVIPARHNADYIDEINYHVGKIGHVVIFLIGDEEADFPVDKLKHGSSHVWVQNPHPGKHDNYNCFGTGYPPQLRSIVPAMEPKKKIDVFFSGQITHKRRELMMTGLDQYIGSKSINATNGFTQGLPHDEYYKRMVSAKISPAPAGAIIPDSFRFYEALECMSMVIADNKNSSGSIQDYWTWMYPGKIPLITIDDYESLPGYIADILDKWPNNILGQTTWWIEQKRDFAYKVMEQLYE